MAATRPCRYADAVLEAWNVDYRAVLAEGGAGTLDTALAWLLEELPYVWYASYKRAVGRAVDVQRIERGAFLFLHDAYPGTNREATGTEARTVAAIGCSTPQLLARDDARLRGWLGPARMLFGEEWDKGHFIAHSIGGAVDRAEMNVFLQRTALNRGWSDEGKIYTEMERTAARTAGTLFFSRPIYEDQRARPAFLEVGVLRGPRDLWVEVFDNR